MVLMLLVIKCYNFTISKQSSLSRAFHQHVTTPAMSDNLWKP